MCPFLSDRIVHVVSVASQIFPFCFSHVTAPSHAKVARDLRARFDYNIYARPLYVPIRNAPSVEECARYQYFRHRTYSCVRARFDRNLCLPSLSSRRNASRVGFKTSNRNSMFITRISVYMCKIWVNELTYGLKLSKTTLLSGTTYPTIE